MGYLGLKSTFKEIESPCLSSVSPNLYFMMAVTVKRSRFLTVVKSVNTVSALRNHFSGIVSTMNSWITFPLLILGLHNFLWGFKGRRLCFFIIFMYLKCNREVYVL